MIESERKVEKIRDRGRQTDRERERDRQTERETQRHKPRNDTNREISMDNTSTIILPRSKTSISTIDQDRTVLLYGS